MTIDFGLQSIGFSLMTSLIYTRYLMQKESYYEMKSAHKPQAELSPLTTEEEMLLACYRSGQIEAWAFLEHLEEHPNFRNHLLSGAI